MTIIVVRNGEMASDSRFTSDGLITKGTKIFRKNDALIGIAGDVAPALIFVDWYGNQRSRAFGTSLSQRRLHGVGVG